MARLAVTVGVVGTMFLMAGISGIRSDVAQFDAMINGKVHTP